MKFFYKVDGEHFAIPAYYKNYWQAFECMMIYAQGQGQANAPLDYVREDRFGWKLVYIEKIYFDGEEE
jgi:hypothetical protein